MEKKLKVCWIKGIKEDTCIYKCNDKQILEQPMQRPSPFNDSIIPLPCPQLIFPGKDAPAARPEPASVAEKAAAAAPADDKKIKVCWIKGIKEDTCVYKCNDGRTLEQPMQRPSPYNDSIIPLPCPQLLFPGKN
ncbi:MAG TPA: hypothetical protein PKI19_09465 [Elusimicrobiales bacterium]|nr:hypothetical protein [Elusimicrobiales bacterium]